MKDNLRNNKVDYLTSKNIDFHGRKIVNAGSATDSKDYTTLQDIRNFISNLLRAPITFFNNFFLPKLLPNLPLRLTKTWQVISQAIDIATSDISGVLSVANGGTNNNSQTTDGVAYFDGTKIITSGLLYYNGSIFAVNTITPITGLTPENLFQVHGGTDENFLVTGKVTLSTGVTIRTPTDDATTQQGLELRSDPILFGVSTAQIGFFGGTPASQQTLAAYTANNQSAAYTATPLALINAATLADLNILRVAYENLRVMVEDHRTKDVATTLVKV